MRRVAVIGGGVGGLAAALATARRGRRVILVERDAADPPEVAMDAPEWARHGIPHFLQPHAFLSRGVKVLREEFPDVYRSLLDAGAVEIDLARKLPSPERVPGDADLVFLGCRRPLIEWALRKAVSAEANIEIRKGVTAQDLAWDVRPNSVPRAEGVVTESGVIDADLVIDASGRGSALPDWIATAGGNPPLEQSNECGLVYYSRYYRFRPGRAQYEGPWLVGPRADLGFCEVGSFWGDNETFAFVLQIRPVDKELRAVRDPVTYTATLSSMPAIAPFVDTSVAEPITDVLPMGQLRNRMLSFVPDGTPVAEGVIALGDSLCHTNPRYGWGLSLALTQASTLGALLDDHVSDPEGLTLAFEAATRGDIDGAYRASSAMDDDRKLYWGGEGVDPSSPQESLPLFLLLYFPVAGMQDAEIFRMAVRRLMFLDPPQEVERHPELIERAASLVRARFEDAPPKPQGPQREELLEIVRRSRSRAGSLR